MTEQHSSVSSRASLVATAGRSEGEVSSQNNPGTPNMVAATHTASVVSSTFDFLNDGGSCRLPPVPLWSSNLFPTNGGGNVRPPCSSCKTSLGECNSSAQPLFTQSRMNWLWDANAPPFTPGLCHVPPSSPSFESSVQLISSASAVENEHNFNHAKSSVLTSSSLTNCGAAPDPPLYDTTPEPYSHTPWSLENATTTDPQSSGGPFYYSIPTTCHWIPFPGELPFTPKYVNWTRNGQLLLGGKEFFVAILNVASPPWTQSLRPSNCQHQEFSWIHLSALEAQHALCAVSSIGVHLTTFGGSSPLFSFLSHKTRDLGDYIAAVATEPSSSTQLALGTERGSLQWMDLERETITSFTVPETVSSYDPFIVEPITCGLTRDYMNPDEYTLLQNSNDAYFSNNLSVFGTAGGVVVFSDRRCPSVVAQHKLPESGSVLKLVSLHNNTLAALALRLPNAQLQEEHSSVVSQVLKNRIPSEIFCQQLWSTMRAELQHTHLLTMDSRMLHLVTSPARHGSRVSPPNRPIHYEVAPRSITMINSFTEGELTDTSFLRSTNELVQQLSLRDICKHPENPATLVGLDIKGRLLSLRVSCGMSAHAVCAVSVPPHPWLSTIPESFAVLPGMPLEAAAVALDHGGNVFVPRSIPQDGVFCRAVLEDQKAAWDNYGARELTDAERFPCTQCSYNSELPKDYSLYSTFGKNRWSNSFVEYPTQLGQQTSSCDIQETSPHDTTKSSKAFLNASTKHADTRGSALRFSFGTANYRHSMGSVAAEIQEPYRQQENIISDVRAQRPPEVYRLLPTTTALKTIRSIRRAAPQNSSTGVWFHPLRDAVWHRDIEILGRRTACTLSLAVSGCRTASGASCRVGTTEIKATSSSEETFLKNSVGLPDRQWFTHLTFADLGALLFHTEGALALFNRAGPAGLEPSLRCPMVNPIIQVLRSIPILEHYLVRHFCERESCLACELGLLCHMLSLARMEGKGRPCQAKNFIQAFFNIPEARLCKILPELEQSVFPRFTAKTLETTTISFLSFLLQHLRRELADEDHVFSTLVQPSVRYPLIDLLFGWAVQTSSECCVAEHKTVSEPTTRFIVDLSPPSKKTHQWSSTADEFTVGLTQSLERTFTRSAFCKGCNALVRLKHWEKVIRLPHVLVLSCGSFYRAKAHLQKDNTAYCTPGFHRRFWVSEPKSKDKRIKITLIDPVSSESDYQSYCRYDLFATVFAVKENYDYVNLKGLQKDLEARHPLCGTRSPSMPPVLKKTDLHDSSPVHSNTASPRTATSEVPTTDHLVAHIRVPKNYICHYLHNRGAQLSCSVATDGPLSSSFEQPTKVPHCFSGCELGRKRDLLIHDQSNSVGSLDSAVQSCYKQTRTEDLPLHREIRDEKESNDHLGTECRVCGTVESHHKASTKKDGSDAEDASNQFTWVTMNDFVVALASQEEAEQAYNNWKYPICLFYTAAKDIAPLNHQPVDIKTETDVTMPPAPHQKCTTVCPIPTTSVLHNENLSRHPLSSRLPQFTPLSPHEIYTIMQKGQAFSLDAEFVRMSHSEHDFFEDCSLSLARLSVIRAEGPLEGTPCLDCCILTREEPVDYLTRYSGLQQGDLNETHSKYWLSARKNIYQKLRFLLDHNCRFIGHGLSKDFRIINLFVPNSQLIDTAQLYRLPGRRFLSLRFLAYAVLGQDIQGTEDGHDSIEDAHTALLLFKRYQELVAEERVEDLLRELYTIGEQSNWVPPSNDRDLSRCVEKCNSPYKDSRF